MGTPEAAAINVNTDDLKMFPTTDQLSTKIAVHPALSSCCNLLSSWHRPSSVNYALATSYFSNSIIPLSVHSCGKFIIHSYNPDCFSLKMYLKESVFNFAELFDKLFNQHL